MAAWMRSSSSTVRMRTAIEASCLPAATDAADTRRICRNLAIARLKGRTLGRVGPARQAVAPWRPGTSRHDPAWRDFFCPVTAATCSSACSGALPAAADDGEVAAVELEGELLLEHGEQRP